MKVFIAMMLLLSVSFSYTYAGEEYESDENKQSLRMEEREVMYYDFDLEVEVENGKAYASWDDFPSNRGFEWYKLVYSTTNSKPVYPDDRVVFVGERLQLENVFKLDANKDYHYVRLCALVLNDDYSKDRYCGKVQKIETDEEDFRDTEREQYLKEKEEKAQAKKEELQKRLEEKKEQAKQQVAEKKVQVVREVVLSDEMKERIEEVIEKFINKLEDKDYTDAQITSAINTVIQRLGAFKNKAGYQNLVKYMIVVLEEYREEYSNPLEDLESIFEGL